jgi:hypothetical protein
MPIVGGSNQQSRNLITSTGQQWAEPAQGEIGEAISSHLVTGKIFWDSPARQAGDGHPGERADSNG